MALFKRFFFRKPPDGLLEISERVYVFDHCFSTDVVGEDEYKEYIEAIAMQCRSHFPDGSFMVFNLCDGETESQIAGILSEFDMTVMDYPRLYEGCPLLKMEMVHHFLRSCESWLCLGQQNFLLMHCERGGWPVLAFMLAALLIYLKQYSGEQRTLDMVYKQAPHEHLQFLSPLNPLPSQLRYLQYVSRSVASEWPPLDRALTLDCIILRMIPIFDSEGGCRLIFRIYGQDPLFLSEKTSKVLFSTPKKSKLVRHYKQAECELVKVDIGCHIQGDVVIECISLDKDMQREEMMFTVVLNTAFIRSNILMLNREQIDILWGAKDRFSKDFRAEVLLSDMDVASSLTTTELADIEDKGLPVEAFSKVHEIFSHLDWLEGKEDAAIQILRQMVSPNSEEKSNKVTREKVESHRPPQSPPNTKILSERLQSNEKNEGDVSESENSRAKMAFPLSQHSTSVSGQSESSETSMSQPPSSEPVEEIMHSTLWQPSLPTPPMPPLAPPPLELPFYAISKQKKLIIPPVPPSIQSLHAINNVSLVLSPIPPPSQPPSKSEPHKKTPIPLSVISKSLSLLSLQPQELSATESLTSLIYPCPHSSILSSPPPPLSSCLDIPPPPPLLPPYSIIPSTPPRVNPSPPPQIIPSPPPPGLVVSSPPSPKIPTPPPLYLAISSPQLDVLSSSPPPVIPTPPPSPPPPPPCLAFSSPPQLVVLSSLPYSTIPSPPPSTMPSPPQPTTITLASHPPPTTSHPPSPPHLKSKQSDESSSLTSKLISHAPSTTSSSCITVASQSNNTQFVPPPPPNSSSSLLTSLSLGTKRTLTRIKSSKSVYSAQSSSRKTSLKPLHWVKVTRVMSGSLWAETQKSDELSKILEIDMSELESLFSAAVPSSKPHASVGGKSDKIHLIDLRRSNNCEIMLTKIKVPTHDLMTLMLALDESVLDVDQVNNLIKFCPTKEEMELLQGYKGDKESLGKCEQFFLELMKVPRVESKLRVFYFKIQFHSQVADLRINLNTINSGAEEIRRSVKLKRIMQAILSLGNALNQGTARGSAIGFRLDSLLKLCDIRARNNKMTLMHYLCKVLAEKLPEVLDFHKNLVFLEAASKLEFKILAEEMQAINKGVKDVEQALISSGSDGPVSETFCEKLKSFLVAAEAEVRSLTSLYTVVNRNADALVQYFGEDPARCSFEQVVSTLLDFTRMFERAHEENSKQLELERKRAQREAKQEKTKLDMIKRDKKISDSK